MFDARRRIAQIPYITDVKLVSHYQLCGPGWRPVAVDGIGKEEWQPPIFMCYSFYPEKTPIQDVRIYQQEEQGKIHVNITRWPMLSSLDLFNDIIELDRDGSLSKSLGIEKQQGRDDFDDWRQRVWNTIDESSTFSQKSVDIVTRVNLDDAVWSKTRVPLRFEVVEQTPPEPTGWTRNWEENFYWSKNLAEVLTYVGWRVIRDWNILEYFN